MLVRIVTKQNGNVNYNPAAKAELSNVAGYRPSGKWFTPEAAKAPPASAWASAPVRLAPRKTATGQRVPHDEAQS
ncbi:hypothetical protein LJR013_003365 [Pseudarthrobacter oxydans]|uniref:hypothetical protein n=1 Tax=Pseudarthrobacter oxydans TaxID=1671 RepID=UPI003ECFC9B8